MMFSRSTTLSYSKTDSLQICTTPKHIFCIISSFRHWEGGENCDASNESPETKSYTFMLLSQQEVGRGFVSCGNSSLLFFQTAIPEVLWYLLDFSWIMSVRVILRFLPLLLFHFWIFFFHFLNCCIWYFSLFFLQRVGFKGTARNKHIPTKRDFRGCFFDTIEHWTLEWIPDPRVLLGEVLV